MARKPRSSRVKKNGAPAPDQLHLHDGEGEITAHERLRDVDKVCKEMFEARDQEAIWNEARTDAFARVLELLLDHKHEGAYYFDHAGAKYKLEVQHKDKLSVAKCSKKELEFAE